MQIETITARKAVDNAFLQETITEAEFESFRQRLLTLLTQADDAVEEGESEEHLKNLIKPFFSKTNFEENYYINTKERQDLAIHNGKTRKSSVGVMIEAKRPSNTAEMINSDDLNRKAFYESILYYLRERIDNGNDDIKHIIITDIYNWYIFDAQDFERHFYESKKLTGWYEQWKQGQKVSSRTQFVYDHLQQLVDDLDGNIKAAQLNINNYRKLLEKNELSRDEQKKLVPIFKLFTPTHLLKQPFASDSNELNKAFYRELLYIMGLKEYKEKGTHYITRLDEENRRHASLIENTITQLESMNVLSRLPDRREYGDEEDEQLFNVAIQLLITWINRILFLKLLEAQLYKYHREDDRFQFLSHREIREYDGLNKLFFQVLAKPIADRPDRINKQFGHIPYLNSSLFDVADIEADTLFISALEDGLEMPVYSRSKIRTREGERLKGKKLSALEYLLRFLDAYNFNTEGTAEVQQEAKTLINASVLGRIFEKINGYKDGSFFTPGYITEYMCRETIRRAVVQKFAEVLHPQPKPSSLEGEGRPTGQDEGARDSLTFADIHNAIGRDISMKEANEIVNSITICDSAVGSGHFLVSALNELIAIKSELGIFCYEDEQGNLRRFRDVDISVDNDELSIAVGQDPFFEYRVHHSWNEDHRIERTVGSDTQRLQKALFREKNILIENCLFGVDINPNSVNICRLRLWIELLKHAYYKDSPKEKKKYHQLEVLPNIDINIKQGNSLVSRFDLDADLSQILTNNDDLTIEEYKQAVRRYKETGDRDDKRELKEQISAIKESFSVGLKELHPVRQKLKKQREVLIKEEAKLDLFEGDKKSKKEQKKITKTKKKIADLEEELEELENATFYQQAFEWRFEFPEVLDEDGNYTGFDAVIGNPPYVRQELLKDIKPYLKENYEVYHGTADLYQYFIQRGMEILKERGFFHYIVSNKWMRANYGKSLREWIQQFQIKSIIDFGDLQVFEEATTYPCLVQISKKEYLNDFDAVEVESLAFDSIKRYARDNIYKVDQGKLDLAGWALIRKEAQQLLGKINELGDPLKDFIEGDIHRGAVTGLNKVFVIDEEQKESLYQQDSSSREVIYPVLKGKDVNRYSVLSSDRYLIYLGRDSDIDKYPAVKEYLSKYRERLEPKPKNWKGDKWLGRSSGNYKWFETQSAFSNYSDWLEPKIIYPDLANRCAFTIDLKGEFLGLNTTYVITEADLSLLGVLNSKLIEFYYQNVSSSYRGGYLRFFTQYVENIPIVEPEKETKEQIESLVTQILTAKEEDSEADTSELEAKIDQLVYELYGLTDEEIAIVEESVA